MCVHECTYLSVCVGDTCVRPEHLYTSVSGRSTCVCVCVSGQVRVSVLYVRDMCTCVCV